MGKRKQRAPAAPRPAPDTRPVNQRGTLHQVGKLTGNRAQRGNLTGGAPRFVYEVKRKRPPPVTVMRVPGHPLCINPVQPHPPAR